MVLLPLLFFQVFQLVQGTIILERIEQINNRDYYSANVSIVDYYGHTAVNLDAVLHKTWGMRLTFRVSLYSMQTNKPRLLLALPKLSYCDIMRSSEKIPIVTHLIRQFTKFGNLSITCPICKSSRYLRNYYIDDADIPLIKALASNARYMLLFVFNDEGGKVPINVIRGKLVGRVVKS